MRLGGESRASRTVQAALVLMGATAVIAQIVFLRELMVVFNGSEISLGLILGIWLLWTAFGSAVLGTMLNCLGNPLAAVAACEVLLGMALPAGIFAVRASRSVFASVPGQALGPGAMMLTAILALSAFCALSGCLFAVGSRAYSQLCATGTAPATGRVYLLESIGSAAGGLIGGILLVRYFGAFAIALALTLLNLLLALLLGFRSRKAQLLTTALLLVIALPGIYPLSRALERRSLGHLWRGFEVIATRNSLYGNLVLTGSEGMRTLYENGGPLFHIPDPAAAEEAVHYALLQHVAPARVLLIGGGVSGSLREVLKHPTVRRVDYVELDPAIIDMTQQFFPDEWSRAALDPRVRVHHLDGRSFLKPTESRFDVIIVNVPDPQTAQLNRFYTVEFFREASAHLTSYGILALQFRGSEDYIAPELAGFLRCMNRTLHEVFPAVKAMPGATIHFFASNKSAALPSSPDELVRRLQARQVDAQYVREYFIPFRMSPDRMMDLNAAIQFDAATPVNRDFEPIAYYSNTALWSGEFDSSYRRFLTRISKLSFARMAGFSLAAMALLAGVVLLLTHAQTRRRLAAGASMAAMGFTLMALEILLLLGFQAIYGYVYHKLATIIAMFMAGMAAGTWTALRIPASRHPMRMLSTMQLAAVIAPVVLVLVLAWFRTQHGAAFSAASLLGFPMLATVSGLLGGLQFPIASRVYFSGDSEHRGTGALYALDLIGAFLGAILLSAYLLPVFGFVRIAVLIAAGNLVVALLGSRDWGTAKIHL